MGTLKVKHMAFGAIIAAGLCAPAIAQDTFKIEPGNWTMLVNIEGQIQAGGQTIPFPPQDVTIANCITPEQAILSKDQLIGQTEEIDCTATEFRATGSNLSLAMTCSMAGVTMNGRNDMAFSADRKSGTGASAMSGSGPNGERFDLKQTIKMTHTGPC